MLGQLYGVTHVSILNWVKQKDAILAECRECARIVPGAGSPGEAIGMARRDGENVDGLLRENRRLRKESSRQEDRIAYLESLLELSGIDERLVRKKKGTGPSCVPKERKEGKT
jgi:hypothetical protein